MDGSGSAIPQAPRLSLCRSESFEAVDCHPLCAVKAMARDVEIDKADVLYHEHLTASV